MGKLIEQTTILEFSVQIPITNMAEDILKENPKIIGIGIYIWNVKESLELIETIKALRSNIKIIIGGPEVSFEYENNPAFIASDYLIKGEADFEFYKLCSDILGGGSDKAFLVKVFDGKIPDINAIKLPYNEYTNEDIDNKFVYIETSRGCPFSCDFCLSALDNTVRYFDLDIVIKAVHTLISRGAKRFKFIDRTFNLNPKRVLHVLKYLNSELEKRRDLFFHFEIVPDYLAENILPILSWFPEGAIQFEVGIQSFKTETLKLINRKQNLEQAATAIDYLVKHTNIMLLTDIIVGLPGEQLTDIEYSFNKLIKLHPNEIQVEILKRLKGAPIIKHTKTYGMIFSNTAPYEILENNILDFNTMQRLKRFAQLWNIFYNHGKFKNTMGVFIAKADSVFLEFMKFSDWIYSQISSSHSIANERQSSFLFEYLLTNSLASKKEVFTALDADWHGLGTRKYPKFLLELKNDCQT